MRLALRKRRRSTTRLAVQTEHALARGASTSPMLPHEHDESPEDATAADPRAVQAEADVARGLVDTEARQEATDIFNARRRKSKTMRR